MRAFTGHGRTVASGVSGSSPWQGAPLEMGRPLQCREPSELAHAVRLSQMIRVFRHYVSSVALALFLLDGVAVAALYYAVCLAQGGLNGTVGQAYTSQEWWQIVLTILFVPTILYSLGVYDQRNLVDFRAIIPRLAICYVGCLLFVRLMFHLSPSYEPVLVAAVGSVDVSVTSAIFAGLFLLRVAFRAVAGTEALQQHVLVIGVGKRASAIEELVNSQKNSSSVVIVGFLPVNNEKFEVDPSKIIFTNESLREIVQRARIKEIVIAVDDPRGMSIEPLLELRMTGVRITDFLTFWERESRMVSLDYLNPKWLIYSDGFRASHVCNACLKRVLDIAVSLLFLIFMLPLMIAVSIAIVLDNPGPIFYRQERVGKGGKVFVLIKFRTMRVDAENDGVPQWAQKNDPRITRVGAILRMTRIDEIPQVINVLKQDMSFVGPRPERPFFVETLCREIPHYAARHYMRPGITGWAQICYLYGASIEDAKKKLAYDLYYIKNYSVMFDLLIILRTAYAVLWNKGAR